MFKTDYQYVILGALELTGMHCFCLPYARIKTCTVMPGLPNFEILNSRARENLESDLRIKEKTTPEPVLLEGLIVL